MTNNLPCDDAISREDALNGVDAMYNNSWDLRDFRHNVDLMLKELPPVTPSRRYGAWIGIDEEPHEDFECCVCGKAIYAIEDLSEYKYCPNCGAKMTDDETNAK